MSATNDPSAGVYHSENPLLYGGGSNESHSDAFNSSFGRGVAKCPSDSSMSLDFPSTTFLWIALTVAMFGVALLVACRYNYITWWGGDHTDVLRISSVSNNYWVLYFAACGVRALLGSLLFGTNSLHTENPVNALGFAMHAAHAAGDFFLTVSLFHQHQYRSDCHVHTGTTTEDLLRSETTTDGEEQQRFPTRVKRVLCSLQALAGMLTLVTVATAWFATHNSTSPYSDTLWAFFFSICVQRLPIYGLLLLIVVPCDPTRGGAAPTLCSRIVLFMGFVWSIPYDIPYKVFSDYMLTESVVSHHDGCPLSIFSWYDVTLLAHAIATAHFCYFIVAEYKRTHELEFYDCIQQYTAQPAIDAM